MALTGMFRIRPCVGTAPSRNDRELSHEARGRSGGRVDDVEAVRSHEDAIAATTSGSSSFSTLTQHRFVERLLERDVTTDVRSDHFREVVAVHDRRFS